MSWKPEVIADNSGKWCGNALRFATKEEAEAQVFDLSCRWTEVRETRAIECDDPVNSQWVDGRTVPAGPQPPIDEEKLVTAHKLGRKDWSEGGSMSPPFVNEEEKDAYKAGWLGEKRRAEQGGL